MEFMFSNTEVRSTAKDTFLVIILELLEEVISRAIVLWANYIWLLLILLTFSP